MRQGISALIMLIMFSTSQTYAQDLEHPYYYGLSVGQSAFHVAGEGDPTLALYLGRFFRKNLSVEGGFADLGEGGDPRQAASATTIYAGGVLHLYAPPLPGFSGFVSAGLQSWYFKEGKEKDSGVDLYYGAGLMYALDEELSLRVAYHLFALNPTFTTEEFDEEVSVISFGVEYRP